MAPGEQKNGCAFGRESRVMIEESKEDLKEIKSKLNWAIALLISTLSVLCAKFFTGAFFGGG